MATSDHLITFAGVRTVRVPDGTLLIEAAEQAGAFIQQPCGGQGRCGRCAVQVTLGAVRRRSTMRLLPEDLAAGYALACQSVVVANATIQIPPQEAIARRITSDRVAREITAPADYDPVRSQTLRRVHLTLTPPSLDDQTDDWSRVQTALRQTLGTPVYHASLAVLRQLSGALRAEDWAITALVETSDVDHNTDSARLMAVWPGHVPTDEPLWGVAIDIGTTTVTVWLVDLQTGTVRAQEAEYNGQIARGEDVISRIIFAGKNHGDRELHDLVVETINGLVAKVCQQVGAEPETIFKATVAGNSTMVHLLLQLPAETIRRTPFVTGINHPLPVMAQELGIALHPEATVDCLPGVASYVGADISAGVLAAGLTEAEPVTLFMDIGTNGETVLGNEEWLVTCACSAGPAFEGAGVLHGMRATQGAVEDVWINAQTYEPAVRVIGDSAPRGLCGSGLIALLAEMFVTGVIDKSGNVDLTLDTPRVRTGAHGPEYVVVWGSESATGRDIAITHVDIDNLLRAKAAIYAGFVVLAESVGFPLEAIEQVLIGGAFGKYINVEKAIQIGLLPDMPWDRFKFLGNTAVQGAYQALIDWHTRSQLKEIADRMTYIELSADNRFYDAFTSALFLPHTDLARFPTVQAVLTS